MRPPFVLAAATSFLCLAVAPRARAEDKAACVASAEAAQSLRTDNKLRAARAQLIVCAAESCPPVVRSDCAQWLTEVNATLPTVVVRAQDTRGRDVTDVRVRIDGEVVAARLDGRPIPYDPGEHAIDLERGAEQKHLRMVLRAGEQNRPVAVVFAATDAARDARAPEVPSRGPPALAWGLAGLAVVGAGSFAYFGL